MNVDWNEVNAICTGLAAVATAVMAGFTWKTIRDSRKQHRDLRQQNVDTMASSERHHQDSFRPVLVVAPHDGVDPIDRNSLIEFDQTERTGNTRQVRIHGVLKNVGVGPALVVRLHVQAMETKGYGTTHELAPLQAGDAFGSVDSPLRLILRVNDQFNATDFAFAAGTLWELVIEYQDVFGNEFRTLHAKNLQRPWWTVPEITTPTSLTMRPFRRPRG